MKVVILAIIVISAIRLNASFKIDSMLEGTEVSLGLYNTSVSVGNLTEKYLELEPADVKATKNAVELIELLRRMFGVGIFTLPPLDPYITKKLKPLNIETGTLLSGKILLKSLTVTGAKHFDLKLFELRMKTGRVDFEIDFPEVNFHVDFQTDLYFGGLIPLSLNGALRGQIVGLQLIGALQTEVRLPGGTGPNVVYQLSGVSVHVRANDLKVSLVKGMHLDNDLLESIYSGEDNASLAVWLASTRNMINKYAVNTFIYLANNVLRSLSVGQVNAFLLPEDQLK